MNEDWAENRKFVLEKLKTIQGDVTGIRSTLDSLDHKIDDIKVEVEKQRVRTGFLGLLAGSIPGLISVLLGGKG